MKQRLLTIIGATFLAWNARTAPQQATLDTAKIEAATGLKGTLSSAENVFKVTQARTDVRVSVDGRPLEPFMGLTSWAAFTPGKDASCMVMGDLVLFQDEITPAMDAAFANGLAITALHNHFLFDEPRVFFMHLSGEGNAEALAKGVRACLDAVHSVRTTHSEPVARTGSSQVPTASAIPSEKIEGLLGTKGQTKDGMFKAVLGRNVHMPCGCGVGKEMGVNTWAAFAGTEESAIVDGDFVTFDGELQPVLKALRKSGIQVVAIHSHMEGESPKALFLHYWGQGPAEDLARGVRAALDMTSEKPGAGR